MINCILCNTPSLNLFFEYQQYRYFRCPACQLTFMDPQQHLSPVEEKKRYDLHQNKPTDPNYRNFLNKLLKPLLPHLKKLKPPENSTMHGLDFGCGPGPTLSVMLNELGYTTKNYDPLYFPDHKLLTERYSYITCTEAVEHFHNPKKEFALLKKLLKPEGILGIMTLLLEKDSHFADWYYKNDPTHVCFFKKATFDWIAYYYSFKILSANNSVIFLKVI